MDCLPPRRAHRGGGRSPGALGALPRLLRPGGGRGGVRPAGRGAGRRPGGGDGRALAPAPPAARSASLERPRDRRRPAAAAVLAVSAPAGRGRVVLRGAGGTDRLESLPAKRPGGAAGAAAQRPHLLSLRRRAPPHPGVRRNDPERTRPLARDPSRRRAPGLPGGAPRRDDRQGAGVLRAAAEPERRPDDPARRGVPPGPLPPGAGGRLRRAGGEGAPDAPPARGRARRRRLRRLKTASRTLTRSLSLGLLLLSSLGCRGGEKAQAPVLRIAARTGEYIHAVAGQESCDVVLTLLDARGRQLLRVDSLAAASAPPLPAEEIHWVADAPGELRIERRIELAPPPGSRGSCDLRLAERRRATAADRRRALAEAELARAHSLRQTRQTEPCRTGIALYESAQSGFADLGLPRRRAEALLGLGQLQLYCLHDDRAALQAFTRAAPLFAGDPAFEALVRLRHGELRFAAGDLNGAIAEYKRALELNRRLGERARELVTANDLGHALYLRGRYDEAATHFARALALWKPGDDPGKRANTLLNWGHLHRQLGEWDQAREQFQEALGLYRQAKDRSGEAIALHALGLLAQDEKRTGDALAPLQAALKLRAPGSRGRAATLTALGVAYRQLGRLEEARRAYTEALPIFRRLGDSREQARGYSNLGRLEATAGHDAAALDDFDNALALFPTLADSPDVAWVLEGKARMLRRRGELAAARQAMDEALSTIEQHRFSQASYTTRADFFSTQQGSYDFLIDLLLEMHRKAPTADHAAAALEVSERSLARSLLDGLAASGAHLRRGGAAPELHARERQLEAAISALVSHETRLAQDPAAAVLLRPVEAALRQRWEELDRVRAELRTGDPRYAALTQPQPASLAEIQHNLLDRDTLLLEYRLGEARSFLWAVTPDSLQSFELPGRAAIERVAGLACDLLARSRDREAELSAGPRAAGLSRPLLNPVAPLLAGKRLLVVGDGIQQSVPFAALHEPACGPGGGEPL